MSDKPEDPKYSVKVRLNDQKQTVTGSSPVETGRKALEAKKKMMLKAEKDREKDTK